LVKQWLFLADRPFVIRSLFGITALSLGQLINKSVDVTIYRANKPHSMRVKRIHPDEDEIIYS
jgi:hypothetical protein